MKEDGWLEVVNVDKLIKFSRKIIYHNFDEDNDDLTDTEFLQKVDASTDQEDEKEIESLLPFGECRAIFKPFLVRVLSKDDLYYKIKEDDYDEILIQMNRRMVSNIVKGLVAKGLVESAFDNDKNDFVFWVKDQ
jgi:uncharacterized Zn finger protein